MYTSARSHESRRWSALRLAALGSTMVLTGIGAFFAVGAPEPASAATACAPEPGFTHCLLFEYTGADQTLVVPLGASDLDVAAWGAGGAGRVGVRGGGGGGYVHATYAVAPGTALHMIVGGAGGSNTWSRTYGGGGAAGTGPNFGGAGGGLSGIFLDDATPVVIAGGGGGSSVRVSGTTSTDAGGGGGGATGTSVSASSSLQGQPGTQTSGGAAGTGGTCTVRLPAPGASSQGGDGGSNALITGQPNGGGGGGGGYFGGGGGSCGTTNTVGAGGGGGGSGYVSEVVADAVSQGGTSSDVVNTGGASGGEGQPFHQPNIGNGGGPTPTPSGGAGNGQIVVQFSLPAPAVTTPTAGSTVSTQPEITGTAEPGTLATVLIDGAAIACAEGDPVQVDPSGTFRCTPSTPLSAGVHSVEAQVQDPAAPDIPYPSSTQVGFAVLVEEPSLVVVKSADTSALSTSPREGETITFGFSVSNNGNILIDAITISDDLDGLGTIEYNWPGEPGILSPGDTLTASATYMITQRDIDTGSISNTATVSGTSAFGSSIAESDSVDLDLDRAPGITLVKTADTNEIVEDDQGVIFAFAVTNVGNVTLTELTIDEVAFSGAGNLGPVTCPTRDLAPGAITVCAAPYAAVSDDLTSPALINTALASATQPSGDRITSGASTVRIPIAAQAEREPPGHDDSPPSALAATGSVWATSLLLVGFVAIATGGVAVARRRRTR